jgi:alkaline phosphatase D
MFARVDRTPGPEISLSMDQWPGYEHERRLLLRHWREAGVRNPVVITGDIHTNWANELGPDFERPDDPVTAVEFVGTSISSSGDGRAEPRGLDRLLAENPGVKFHNEERGYVSCEITPQAWTAHFRTVPFVTRPGAPLVTRASFRVEAGRPKLERV